MTQKVMQKLAKNLNSKNCTSVLSLACMLPDNLVKQFIDDAYAYASGDVLCSSEFKSLENKLQDDK